MLIGFPGFRGRKSVHPTTVVSRFSVFIFRTVKTYDLRIRKLFSFSTYAIKEKHYCYVVKNSAQADIDSDTTEDTAPAFFSKSRSCEFIP